VATIRPGIQIGMISELFKEDITTGFMGKPVTLAIFSRERLTIKSRN
jgi:hypothetical protein